MKARGSIIKGIDPRLPLGHELTSEWCGNDRLENMNRSLKAQILKRFGKVKIYPDGFAVSKALYKGPSGKVAPIIQEKPWGWEMWFFPVRYAMKILFIRKGHRLSLQKHKLKSETWLVLKGHPVITINRRKIKTRPNDLVHAEPNTIHRIEAKIDDIEVFETSSPELHDAIRIADDYQREKKRYNPKD